MNSENLIYGFEHWMELHDLENTIEDNMVEVPEGVVSVGEKEYHYFGNLPQKDPFDLVVRHGDECRQ